MTYRRANAIAAPNSSLAALATVFVCHPKNGRSSLEGRPLYAWMRKLRAVKESASLRCDDTGKISPNTFTVRILSALSSVEMSPNFKIVLLFVVLIWKSHSEAKSLKRRISKRQVVVPNIFNIDAAQVTEVHFHTYHKLFHRP